MQAHEDAFAFLPRFLDRVHPPPDHCCLIRVVDPARIAARRALEGVAPRHHGRPPLDGAGRGDLSRDGPERPSLIQYVCQRLGRVLDPDKKLECGALGKSALDRVVLEPHHGDPPSSPYPARHTSRAERPVEVDHWHARHRMSPFLSVHKQMGRSQAVQPPVARYRNLDRHELRRRLAALGEAGAEGERRQTGVGLGVLLRPPHQVGEGPVPRGRGEGEGRHVCHQPAALAVRGRVGEGRDDSRRHVSP
mmetsp:Transcript_17774/g.40784  ORF Transcript_17774/g.40784 Transcript_17774/m.40784 type:complete len:249 (-) Transcript_17774:392-1138(-)